MSINIYQNYISITTSYEKHSENKTHLQIFHKGKHFLACALLNICKNNFFLSEGERDFWSIQVSFKEKQGFGYEHCFK